ncbi:hypothetical protein E2I00_003853, partial [Balaenoptera physalus]
EKIANMLPEQLYFLQSPPEEEPEYHADAATQESFAVSNRELCDDEKEFIHFPVCEGTSQPEPSCSAVRITANKNYRSKTSQEGALKMLHEEEHHQQMSILQLQLIQMNEVHVAKIQQLERECEMAEEEHRIKMEVLNKKKMYWERKLQTFTKEWPKENRRREIMVLDLEREKRKGQGQKFTENTPSVDLASIKLSVMKMQKMLAFTKTQMTLVCWERKMMDYNIDQILKVNGYSKSVFQKPMLYTPSLCHRDASDQREDVYIGNHMPCPENLNGYCIHGKCEFIYSTQKASCRQSITEWFEGLENVLRTEDICESGYTGQHCEKTDFSILYVVPSRQKLTHVLIAAIIGAVQIAIIVAIVMCITRL